MKYKILILITLIAILMTSLASATYDLEVKQITVNPNNPVNDYSADTTVKVLNNGPENVVNETIKLKLDFGDSSTQTFYITNLNAGEDILFTANHTWTNSTTFTINASLSEMLNDSNSNNDYKTKDINVVDPFLNMSSEDKTINPMYRSENKNYDVKITNNGNVKAEIVNAYITDLQEINGNETIDNNNIEVEFSNYVNAHNSANDTLKIKIPADTKPSTYEGNLTTAYKELNGTISKLISKITLTVDNHAATITNISDKVVVIGQEFTYQVEANDIENDPLSFSLTSKPIGMTINETTGLISWTPSAVTSKTVTVSVNDGFDTSTTSFKIESKIDAPELGSSVSELQLGNEDAERGEQVTKTYTIKNTGTQTITNLEVQALTLSGNNLSSDYNVIVAISKNTLTVGEEATVSVGVTIPQDEDSERHTIGKIRVKGEGTTKSVNKDTYMSLEAESFLKIKEVRIYANGDDEELSDGDTYDQLKEGNKVKLVITLENRYSSNDNIRIKKTQVKLSDDNWDIDKESSEITIKENDEKDVEISFTISEDLDEDSDRIVIEAFGEDEENDFEHYDKHIINLEIDRENHEIKIVSWNLDRSQVNCQNGMVRLTTTIKNIGSDDEDKVLLRVFSGHLDLNWQKITRDIELDSGDKETYTFNIPVNNVKAGTYYIQMEAYYDSDEKTDSEVATVNVVCNQNTNTNSNKTKNNSSITVITNPTNNNNPNINNNTIYGEPVSAKESFRNSNTYTIILLILVIVLLIVIVGMAASLLKKK